MPGSARAPQNTAQTYRLTERLKLLELQLREADAKSHGTPAPPIHGIHRLGEGGPRKKAVAEHQPDGDEAGPSETHRSELVAGRPSATRDGIRRRAGVAGVLAIVTIGGAGASLPIDRVFNRQVASPAAQPQPVDAVGDVAAPTWQRIAQLATSARRLAQAPATPRALPSIRPRTAESMAATHRPSLIVGMTVRRDQRAALRLPVIITNALPGAIVTVDGLPGGVRFDQGLRIAETSWSLPASAIASAALLVPDTEFRPLDLMVRLIGPDGDTQTETRLHVTFDEARHAVADGPPAGVAPARAAPKTSEAGIRPDSSTIEHRATRFQPAAASLATTDKGVVGRSLTALPRREPVRRAAKKRPNDTGHETTQQAIPNEPASTPSVLGITEQPAWASSMHLSKP